MSNYYCSKCSCGLVSDEIALHRKLYGLAARNYLCLDCQAKYLNSTREKLQEVIDRYHKSGTCMLFAKYE